MKQFLFLLSLAIFIISCNSEQKNPQSVNCKDTLMINNNMYCFDSISEAYYNSVNYKFPQKSDTVPLDTSVIKSTSDGILIKAHYKDVFLKNDTTEGDAMASYGYVKTLAKVGLVHIKGAFWEWTTDYLVNLTSGEKTLLWQEPILSPNKKMIITCSADLLATEMPNGFQLFQINDGELSKVFEKEILNWGPDEIKWESDSTILIKRIKVDDKYNEQYDYVRMKIK